MTRSGGRTPSSSMDGAVSERRRQKGGWQEEEDEEGQLHAQGEGEWQGPFPESFIRYSLLNWYPYAAQPQPSDDDRRGRDDD